MTVSGLSIEFQVNGGEAGPQLRRYQTAFERAGDGLAKFVQPEWLTPIFEAEEARQFDAEGGGSRGPWAPLSPGYAAAKALRYPGNPILEASGKLKAALTSSSSPFALRGFGGDEFTYGTQGVPYASYHQLGTGKMPDRPPFDFSSDFERDLDAGARKAVRDAILAAGVNEFAEVDL